MAVRTGTLGPLWSKRVLNDTWTDPLGLHRVTNDRILPEVHPGITTPIRYAQYYLFYPWALRWISKLELKREEVQEWLPLLDKAFAVGCLLHHWPDDNPFGGPFGARQASEALKTLAGKTIDLTSFRGLKDPNGGFTVHKGPMQRLGLITEAADGQIQLTALGHEAAELHDSMVRGTDYCERYLGRLSSYESMSLSVLQSYGECICPCALKGTSAPRRFLVHRVFLSVPAQRLSLEHFLAIVDFIHAHGLPLNTQSVRQATLTNVRLGRKRAEYRPLAKHASVVLQWRAFYLQSDFVQACETLFFVFCEVLRRRATAATVEEVADWLIANHLLEKLTVEGAPQVTHKTPLASLCRSIHISPFAEEDLLERIRNSTGTALSDAAGAAILLLMVLSQRLEALPLDDPLQLVIRRHWTVRNDDESLWHFFGRFDPARSATPVREFLVSLLRGSVAHRHYLVMNDRQYDLGYFMPDESPILLHDWSKWRYAWKRSFSFSDIRQRTSLFWQVRSLCLELGLIRWNGDEDYELTAAGREQIA